MRPKSFTLLSMGFYLCQKWIDCFALCMTFICPCQQSVPSCSGKLVYVDLYVLCLCHFVLLLSSCFAVLNVILFCCPYCYLVIITVILFCCPVLSSKMLSCCHYCWPYCRPGWSFDLLPCSVILTILYVNCFKCIVYIRRHRPQAKLSKLKQSRFTKKVHLQNNSIDVRRLGEAWGYL